MEKGGKCYITLATGVVGMVFIISGLCVPGQMVFQLKPFARVVLAHGNLANWTAASLNLDTDKFDLVKNNYPEYLKNNYREEDSDDSSDDGVDDSSSSDSSSSDLDEAGPKDDDDQAKSPLSTTRLRRGDFLRRFVGGQEKAENLTAVADVMDESISNFDDSSDSSDSIEWTLEQKLQGVPMDETIKLGLFVSKVCTVSVEDEQLCDDVPIMTALQAISDAAKFAENELTMQFWNNVRMESIFSLLACVGGVACLLASLRPCCEIKQTPTYLGAVSFLAAGGLAFVPIIRVCLMSSDFRESLEAEMNVTTELRMPWSIVLSGIGGAFALITLVLLVFRSCGHVTKKLYKILLSRDDSVTTNGDAVMLHRVEEGKILDGHREYYAEKNDKEKIKKLLP